MNKRQAERYHRLHDILQEKGLTYSEVDQLLRASKTLSTWSEHECNGVIQREGENADGKPFWYNADTGKRICSTSDRETGALKRIKSICDKHNLAFYYQGDPRGCSLYIIRPGDVPEGENVDAFYSRGLAMCID